MEQSGLRSSYPPSALFVVRVWHETMGNGTDTLCMQVKHTLSGETRYFRSSTQLHDYFAGKVPTTQQSETRTEW